MYLKPKKSLGQNFLVDKNIQRKIIEACSFKPRDIVLEIGAGRGELTRLIAHQVASLFSLEIDASLYASLHDDLKGCANVKIINGDILKFNLKKFSRRFKKIKVVGNIPYYISTPIIECLLGVKEKIDSIFITVQKEFARRIVAHSGSKDYGSLSLFIQHHTHPKILFNIKRTSFFPSPKVDSSFLRLEIKKARGRDNRVDEKLLFRLIRSAFNQRRKTLRNSLKDIAATVDLEAFFNQYNINRNIRPEGLCPADFLNLTNFLKKRQKIVDKHTLLI